MTSRDAPTKTTPAFFQRMARPPRQPSHGSKSQVNIVWYVYIYIVYNNDHDDDDDDLRQQ